MKHDAQHSARSELGWIINSTASSRFSLRIGYVTSNGAILTAELFFQRPIGSENQEIILSLSGFVSALIIILLLHKSFQKFSVMRGGQGLTILWLRTGGALHRELDLFQCQWDYQSSSSSLAVINSSPPSLNFLDVFLGILVLMCSLDTGNGCLWFGV